MDQLQELFRRLSESLTGFDSLDPRLAASFAARLRQSPFGADVARLERHFSELERSTAAGQLSQALGDLLDSDASLRSSASQINYLWYLSASLVGDAWEFGSPEEYAGALLWRAIGAHPPALSGGYMGHWRYLPGNID